MQIDSCFELGHVKKIHGIRGEVKLFLDVDLPEKYSDLKRVYIEQKNRLVPFLVERINIQNNIAIVKFRDIDSIEKAEPLLRSRLFLPLAMLPGLGKNRFYRHEIIGFRVIDNKNGRLGKIVSIFETNGNSLVAMEFKGQEILIPLNKDLVIKVNRSRKEIHMELPDGILDI
ncbi:MAG TPA: ribosome maturation factor RimM [Cyclobacteriaceae bacterium]|nr:ribosome maturation factor RimM [Cyclobacteriaceae bacterium]